MCSLKFSAAHPATPTRAGPRPVCLCPQGTVWHKAGMQELPAEQTCMWMHAGSQVADCMCAGLWEPGQAASLTPGVPKPRAMDQYWTMAC